MILKMNSVCKKRNVTCRRLNQFRIRDLSGTQLIPFSENVLGDNGYHKNDNGYPAGIYTRLVPCEAIVMTWFC